MVAPHTGAWIETEKLDYCVFTESVAPHTGAWIETFFKCKPLMLAKSHPTRVRGLKHY